MQAGRALTPSKYMNTLDSDNIERIEENREDLRALAESDLNMAWAAEALLDAADGDTDRDPTCGDGHERDRDRDRGRGDHR